MLDSKNKLDVFGNLKINIESCFSDLEKIKSISMLPVGRPEIIRVGGLNKMEAKILQGLPKSGLKTTEFWATTLTVIASVAGAYAEVLPPKWAIGLSAVATVAYTISRSFVKVKSSNK